jgi:hypothetical protein
MTTAALDMPRTERSTAGWGRLLPGLGGLAFVAGLVALLLSPGGYDTGETPAEVVAYASSHETWIVVMGLFAPLAVVLLGGFVAGLHARVRTLATPTEATLVLVGGVVFTVCFALSFTIWAAPLVDVPDETARALAHAASYLAIDDIGWFLFGAAGAGAALMAVPASLAAVRARAVPVWLGWLGVLVGAASAATIVFFGMFAWMAWIAVASLVLLAPQRS